MNLSQANQPQVLLFNLPRDERCAKLEAYLRESGVAVRHVQPKDFTLPVGALLGLSPAPVVGSQLSLPFTDEMMLMCFFDQKRLNALLSFFSETGLKRIALKAMLTPTNLSWSACELHRNLSAEHEQFQRMKKG